MQTALEERSKTPKWIGGKGFGPNASQRAYQQECLKAAIRTLEWVAHEHELIRWALQNRERLKQQMSEET